MNCATVTLYDIVSELNKFDLVDNYSKKFDLSSIYIKAISYDSQNVSNGSLFICKGMRFKSEYLFDAISRGACAYISESTYAEISSVPFIKVNDVRKAMAVVAAAFYGHPAEKLDIVGVTGTKGKTTTTYFIKNIIDKHLKRKSAVLSTVEVFTGNESVGASLTTPESLDLQRYLSEVVENDMDLMTMEVSSQAYLLDRVFGINYKVGIFLNIGDDHVSAIEHKDFNDYLTCKIKLLENSEIAIINRSSDEFDRIYTSASKTCNKVITYGLTDDCDYYADNIKRIGKGYSFDVHANNYNKNFVITIDGRFNVENAVAAISAAKELGVSDDDIYDGLRNTSVIGRMNIFENNGKMVIVDYAHNYVSFAKLYESLKIDYPDKTIISLFGCAGGKAVSRRRDLGTLAGKYARMAYITADDPNYEDLTSICEMIASYVRPFNIPYKIIEDREEAVRDAIANATENDIVILAGKGEEVYQKLNGERVPYASDLILAQECLGLL